MIKKNLSNNLKTTSSNNLNNEFNDNQLYFSDNNYSRGETNHQGETKCKAAPLYTNVDGGDSQEKGEGGIHPPVKKEKKIFPTFNKGNCLSLPREKRGEDVKQFFCGLMDGDGSIQCNHWKNKYIQYRLVIKLKKHPLNLSMLREISNHIGGHVRSAGEFLLWVENHQRRIWEICEIFSQYPPLTTRLQCQLQHLHQCREKQSVEWMLAQRAHKWDFQEERRKIMDLLFPERLHYFPHWCSGFIEAEGCFFLRTPSDKEGIWCFSIGQKGDSFLLKSLARFFQSVNAPRQIGKDFYFWEVYRKSVLHNIVKHCEKYPLRGEKTLSFSRFRHHVSSSPPPLISNLNECPVI